MSEIGRAYVPISVPFGFHNRFYSSNDLETNPESSSPINNYQHPHSWRSLSSQLPPFEQPTDFWSYFSKTTTGKFNKTLE